MLPKALVGIDLWRLYAESGHVLSATQVARAVGVSPTTMLKYLAVHCPEYAPRKGWSPSKGWNWSGALGRVTVHRMKEVLWSNSKPFEVGPEVGPEELKDGDDVSLNFSGAMRLVVEGMAVSRAENCSRVVFYDGKQVMFGASNERGVCTAVGPYVPTLEDIDAKDWMVDAHVVKEA